MAVSEIYMEEWNENSSSRKTEKITALAITQLRQKFRYVMNNVIDSQDNVLEEIHECDILYITLNDYAVEYEIKVSKSDLLADAKKHHGHEHRLIKQKLELCKKGYQRYLSIKEELL